MYLYMHKYIYIYIQIYTKIHIYIVTFNRCKAMYDGWTCPQRNASMSIQESQVRVPLELH